MWNKCDDVATASDPPRDRPQSAALGRETAQPKLVRGRHRVREASAQRRVAHEAVLA